MGSKTGGARRGDRAPACRSCPAPSSRSASDAPDEDDRARTAARIGYPLMVKAVAGGGGKGMRVVDARRRTSPSAVRTARSEAGAAFGDAGVYLERRIVHAAAHRDPAARRSARHGAAVRRARVLDPAAPSEGGRGVAVDRASTPTLRRRMAAAAAAVAARGRLHQRRHDRVPPRRGRRVLLPRDEHAAAGRASGHRDGDRRRSRAVADPHRARRARSTSIPARALTPRGHAIECRIYAEDPDQGFMPSPGLIRGLRPAGGPGHPRRRRRRAPASTVPVFYDSMIAKLVAWADTRDEAIARMSRALREYQVLGIRTTIPFFQWLMARAGVSRRAVRHDVPRSAAGRRGAARASPSSTPPARS